MLTSEQHPTSSRNGATVSPKNPQGDHVRAPHSFDTLRQAAGKAGFRHATGKKFKVVNYRDWISDGHSASRYNTSRLKRNPVVVFAKPGKEAGRKVVDYYYTWKGKTGTRSLKGSNRRSHFLQEEFGKDMSKLTEAIGQAAKEPKRDKAAHDPPKTGNETSSGKPSGSVSSGTAQSLPMGIDNSLSKLRIMNPDPSRSSKSSGSSRKSPPRKPSQSSKSDSPWSSSETLQNPLSDGTSVSGPQICPSATCGSESSGASSTEALIVLLDEDEDESDSSVGLSRGTSWHGLERRASSKSYHIGHPYQHNSHSVSCIGEEDCCSDDTCSDQECCDSDYCPPPPPPPCNPTTHYVPTPVQPIYHLPSTPVTTPLVVPGFVPSPMPHRSVTLPPPGFVPLSPRSMQDVIREGRSDVYAQSVLDSYAANSPYAVRPSLYFSPNSPGTVPLPHTPATAVLPLSFNHPYMAHQTSY